jgi:rhamnosyltransferase
LWFGRKIYYTNHSAIRRYYITRNRLDLVCRHGLYSPLFVGTELYKILGEWLKVLLFEQDKWRKSTFIFKGAFDFLRRRFGKIS